MITKKIFIKNNSVRSNVEYFSDTSMFHIVPVKNDIISLSEGKDIIITSRSFDCNGDITLNYNHLYTTKPK